MATNIEQPVYDDDKGSIKQYEQVHSSHHLAVQMPASLAALSPEELAEVDRMATRKLDILLMPILVALYILVSSHILSIAPLRHAAKA